MRGGGRGPTNVGDNRLVIVVNKRAPRMRRSIRTSEKNRHNAAGLQDTFPSVHTHQAAVDVTNSSFLGYQLHFNNSS